MIDTLKLSYPADQYLILKYKSWSDKYQKISPDGVVIWEKTNCSSELPSHFSGLRISYVNASDLQLQGFKNVVESRIEFEFSLQKWHSETGYNNKNSSLEWDLVNLTKWIWSLSEFFGYEFDIKKFTVCRIDFAENFILTKGSVSDYLRSLELKFSPHPNGEKKLMRFDGAVQYGSTWIGKKMYSKFLEFEQIEKRKHRKLYLAGGSDVKIVEGGKRPLNETEISELVRMLRFEVEFRKKFLKKAGVTSIASIPDLLDRFESEKNKYLTVKNIREGQVALTNTEYMIVDLCKRYGCDGARDHYTEKRSRAAWYKHKANLQMKGVYLEAILNTEWRLEVENTDFCEQFELVLAA